MHGEIKQLELASICITLKSSPHWHTFHFSNRDHCLLTIQTEFGEKATLSLSEIENERWDSEASSLWVSHRAIIV